MALDVGGRHDEARARRTTGCAGKQRADGGWHAYYLGDDVEDPTLDTNVTCYVATGAWHHHLATGDTAYLRRAVADGRGRDRLRARLPARDRRDRVARRRPRRRRAAHRLVEHPPEPALRDRDRRAARPRAPRLGALARRLAIAIAHRPDVFLDKDRWAMDWYYPILGGVLRGYPAHARVAARLGDVRGRRARRALRVRPPVDHRGRDVRAGDGARRDRRRRPGPPAVRVGAVPARRRRRLLDRRQLRRRRLPRSTASSTPSSSRRGTRPRSCSRRTRSRARARPRGCSAASASPRASAPRRCSPPASRSNEERARKRAPDRS